jgi:hypothetical protein
MKCELILADACNCKAVRQGRLTALFPKDSFNWLLNRAGYESTGDLFRYQFASNQLRRSVYSIFGNDHCI